MDWVNIFEVKVAAYVINTFTTGEVVSVFAVCAAVFDKKLVTKVKK